MLSMGRAWRMVSLERVCREEKMRAKTGALSRTLSWCTKLCPGVHPGKDFDLGTPCPSPHRVQEP